MVSGLIRTKMSDVNDCDLASMEWKNGVPRNLDPYRQIRRQCIQFFLVN